MTSQTDQKYLAALSAVIDELKSIYHYQMLLDGEDAVNHVTEECARFYEDTGDAKADQQRLREGVKDVLEKIDLEEQEAFTGTDYTTLVSEIEQHETSSLVMIDRNHVNGNVTFKFYDNSGELAGKLTFDEIDEEMIGRANAVTDHLAAAETTVLYQDEVEAVWDAYDPEQNQSIQI
ncbi:hypothetical protein G6L37_02645 [Agrobacterium rubi]|nr:hypothetical protein [Agrobacterium rubi]NTF24295.1 hypothetical protein [Agrobacterium rubi]